MARSPKTPETQTATQAIPASPPVTFDPAIVQQMIAEAVAIALKAQAAELQAAKASKPSDQSSKNAWAAKKAFAKKGIKDAEPNVNIFTYNRWIEKGYRVKPGEKAVKVNNLRLFAACQVEKLDPKEHKEALGKLDAKRQAKPAAKVVPINQPSLL